MIVETARTARAASAQPLRRTRLTEYPPPAHTGSRNKVLCLDSPARNQILIAARLPLLPGQVFAPALHDAVPPNFLHVTLPDIGVDCFGVRIPVGSGFDHLKRSLWEWLLDTAASKVDARALLTGDLNTHPGDSHARCGDCLASLQELGWRSGSPVRGASFGGPEGSRKIDHLYVTSSLTVSNSVYDWEWTNAENGWDKVGLPDHAMIVADLS